MIFYPTKRRPPIHRMQEALHNDHLNTSVIFNTPRRPIHSRRKLNKSFCSCCTFAQLTINNCESFLFIHNFAIQFWLHNVLPIKTDTLFPENHYSYRYHKENTPTYETYLPEQSSVDLLFAKIRNHVISYETFSSQSNITV